MNDRPRIRIMPDKDARFLPFELMLHNGFRQEHIIEVITHYCRQHGMDADEVIPFCTWIDLATLNGYNRLV